MGHVVVVHRRMLKVETRSNIIVDMSGTQLGIKTVVQGSKRADSPSQIAGYLARTNTKNHSRRTVWRGGKFSELMRTDITGTARPQWHARHLLRTSWFCPLCHSVSVAQKFSQRDVDTHISVVVPCSTRVVVSGSRDGRADAPRGGTWPHCSHTRVG